MIDSRRASHRYKMAAPLLGIFWWCHFWSSGRRRSKGGHLCWGQCQLSKKSPDIPKRIRQNTATFYRCNTIRQLISISLCSQHQRGFGRQENSLRCFVFLHLLIKRWSDALWRKSKQQSVLKKREMMLESFLSPRASDFRFYSPMFPKRSVTLFYWQWCHDGTHRLTD